MVHHPRNVCLFDLVIEDKVLEGRKQSSVEIGGLHVQNFGDDFLLILFVIDPESVKISEIRYFFTQKGRAEGVVGRNIGEIDPFDLFPDPVSHLACRFPRKSEAEYPVGRNIFFFDEIKISCYERFCLSGACSGNDPYITFSLFYGR